MKLFVSYAGDIICLLPVLNILSLTVLPGKFIKNTEQVPKKITSEFPCPRFTVVSVLFFGVEGRPVPHTFFSRGTTVVMNGNNGLFTLHGNGTGTNTHTQPGPIVSYCAGPVSCTCPVAKRVNKP